jgi:hypothetical protein
MSKEISKTCELSRSAGFLIRQPGNLALPLVWIEADTRPHAGVPNRVFSNLIESCGRPQSRRFIVTPRAHHFVRSDRYRIDGAAVAH